MRKIFVYELRGLKAFSRNDKRVANKAMHTFQIALSLMNAVEPSWDAVHTLCDSLIWPLLSEERNEADRSQKKRALVGALAGGMSNQENVRAVQFEYLSREFGTVSLSSALHRGNGNEGRAELTPRPTQ